MRLIKTKEAAAILQLTPNRIRQLCESGKLVAYRTLGSSGQWRIDQDKLLQQFIPETTRVVVEEPVTPDTSVFDKIKQITKR